MNDLTSARCIRDQSNALRTRNRYDQTPSARHDARHCTEKCAGICEVFDHLTRDDDVERATQLELGELLDVALVQIAIARGAHSLQTAGIEIDSDEACCDRTQLVVQQIARGQPLLE